MVLVEPIHSQISQQNSKRYKITINKKFVAIVLAYYGRQAGHTIILLFRSDFIRIHFKGKYRCFAWTISVRWCRHSRHSFRTHVFRTVRAVRAMIIKEFTSLCATKGWISYPKWKINERKRKTMTLAPTESQSKSNYSQSYCTIMTACEIFAYCPLPYLINSVCHPAYLISV